jgi:hypothetical protein
MELIPIETKYCPEVGEYPFSPPSNAKNNLGSTVSGVITSISNFPSEEEAVVIWVGKRRTHRSRVQTKRSTYLQITWSYRHDQT